MDNSVIDIWPENYEAFCVFSRCGTQWTVGSGGMVGLNYPSVWGICKLLGIQPEDESSVFDSIQILEREALRVVRETK